MAKKRAQSDKASAMVRRLPLLMLCYGMRRLRPQPARMLPITDGQGQGDGTLPLDPQSPWPKFRANVLQNGRCAVIPSENDRQPWVVRTGKGIFSSPVVDGDETVYIGSGDNCFYAIDRYGAIKWKLDTGELIDSSALLDNRGRLYFASGDTYVYCLDRETGNVLWRSKAHTIDEVEKEFGVRTFNINWFEGNIGFLPDGTISAPNDNYLVYGLNADTGERVHHYLVNDMSWSLPAVNVKTGRIFFGSCFNFLKNIFCFDAATGKEIWHAGGLGAVSATPLLTNEDEYGAVVIGCFDGYVRALSQKNGALLWKTGLRDHIYASPAQLRNGEIIQACTDGTVYCLNPKNGKIVWMFDTQEPIRSSPAIDALDRIYFGSGEGKLFCIHPDGTLRWWYQCITENRTDINGSPALGKDGVYVAGESGEIFFVPHDYPLRAENAKNPRCKRGPAGDLPEEGTLMIYTEPFGTLRQTPPKRINNNQPLTFSLFVRQKGKTLLSAIDSRSLTVSVSGDAKFAYNVAANERFVSVYPLEEWAPSGSGTVTVSLRGAYRTRLRRLGVKFFGGVKSGTIEQSFTFEIAPRNPAKNPVAVPQGGNGTSTVLELRRMAVPLPTMLPSWNQIGFDTLHYLAGPVEQRGNTTVLWVIGGKLREGVTEVDPVSAVRYPLLMRVDGDLATIYNYDGFKTSFVGSWDMPFGKYRIAAKLDENGAFVGDAVYTATCMCDEIAFYGAGLKLTGLSEFKTGKMHAFGGIRVQAFKEQERIEGVGDVRIERAENGIRATLSNTTLRAAEHVYSIAVLSPIGHPLPLYYTKDTSVEGDSSGLLTSVFLNFDGARVESGCTAVFLVDTYPVLQSVLP